MKTLTITIQFDETDTDINEVITNIRTVEQRIRDMIRDEIQFELGLELEDFTTYEIK